MATLGILSSDVPCAQSKTERLWLVGGRVCLVPKSVGGGTRLPAQERHLDLALEVYLNTKELISVPYVRFALCDCSQRGTE
eukprot:5055571-Amphidinium_carterae.1